MDDLVQKYPSLIQKRNILETNYKLTPPPNKSLNDYSRLRFYDIGVKSSGATKIFILSGEHPREMIAPEAVLNFVKELLTKKQIIVNVNPFGRQQVEQGEYCRRFNLNEVDVNRNWDYEFGKKIGIKSEENPGPYAFSEIETQFAHFAVEEFKPKAFLSVHSGEFGLFMPYAYGGKSPVKGLENMNAVLTKIQDKYCKNCFKGPVGELIGYESSGTCLDYVYEKMKNVEFAFAWEIYTNERSKDRKPRFTNNKRNSSFLQIENNVNKNDGNSDQVIMEGPVDFDKIFTETPTFYQNKVKLIEGLDLFTSNFLERKKTAMMTRRVYTKNENEECINLFNPLTSEAYTETVTNWTNVLEFF